MQKTIIKDWYIINFFDAPEPTYILWGTIHEDPSGRWNPGDYVRTSPVIEHQEDGIFITRNSTYVTIGKGNEASLSVSDFSTLNAGFSPDSIVRMRNLVRRK